MSKGPLVNRIHESDLLWDLCKVIHYVGFPFIELAVKVKPLVEQHGARKVSAALAEVAVHIGWRTMLSQEARKAVKRQSFFPSDDNEKSLSGLALLDTQRQLHFPLGATRWPFSRGGSENGHRVAGACGPVLLASLALTRVAALHRCCLGSVSPSSPVPLGSSTGSVR